MRGTRLFVIALATCGLAGTAAADAKQQEADKLFVEGRELIKQGNAKAACDRFQRAIELDKAAPGVMLNLGLCNEKLGKLGTSLRWYRKAQRAASEAKPERLTDYEEAASTAINQLALRVATVRIKLASDVEVRIAGAAVSSDELESYAVDAGTHEVEARAPGKTSFKTTLTIANQEQKELVVPELVDAPVNVVRVEVTDPGRTRRMIGVGVGVGGVGMIAGSALWAKSVSDQFGEDGVDKPNAEKKLTIATVIGVAGIAMIGTGVYLYIAAPEQERNATALAPVITHDQLGFALSGSF